MQDGICNDIRNDTVKENLTMKKIGPWALPGLAALRLLAGHGAMAAEPEEHCKLLPNRRAGVSHYAVSSVLKLRTDPQKIEHVMGEYQVANCEQALLRFRRETDRRFPDYVYDPSLTMVHEVAPVVEAAPAPQAPELVRPSRRIEDRPKAEL